MYNYTVLYKKLCYKTLNLYCISGYTWVTHLSTLNNQFTDTTHEHVFSLAVFLIAALQDKQF